VRNGETPRYSVLLAGIVFPSKLNCRALHVFQRHFDGAVARTNPRPSLLENSEACLKVNTHAECTPVPVFVGEQR